MIGLRKVGGRCVSRGVGGEESQPRRIPRPAAGSGGFRGDVRLLSSDPSSGPRACTLMATIRPETCPHTPQPLTHPQSASTRPPSFQRPSPTKSASSPKRRPMQRRIPLASPSPPRPAADRRECRRPDRLDLADGCVSAAGSPTIVPFLVLPGAVRRLAVAPLCPRQAASVRVGRARKPFGRRGAVLARPPRPWLSQVRAEETRNDPTKGTSHAQ